MIAQTLMILGSPCARKKGIAHRLLKMGYLCAIPACPTNPALACGHYIARTASCRARVSGLAALGAGPASHRRRAVLHAARCIRLWAGPLMLALQRLSIALCMVLLWLFNRALTKLYLLRGANPPPQKESRLTPTLFDFLICNPNLWKTFLRFTSHKCFRAVISSLQLLRPFPRCRRQG